MRFLISLLSIGIFATASALASEKNVFIDETKIERMRNELKKSWSSWKPSATRHDIVEISHGEFEEGPEFSLCEYKYEKMIYDSQFTPAMGFQVNRELINWDLGPNTTADEEHCETKANGPIQVQGMGMAMGMLLDIDKILRMIGQMTGVIHEARVMKVTTGSFADVSLYHFTYFIKGTTTDDMDIDIPGMGDAAPNLPFELTLTISYGKDVTPAALVWGIHAKVKMAGVEKESNEQAVTKFNGVTVPAFQY